VLLLLPLGLLVQRAFIHRDAEKVGLLGNSYPGSCITTPNRSGEERLAPVQYRTLTLHVVVAHKGAGGRM
jgi:hypothetical protein